MTKMHAIPNSGETHARRALMRVALGLTIVTFGCGSSNAPRGFQEYRLGASRESIEPKMSHARQLGEGERLLYNFITDDIDGTTVTRWIDRRRVQSGDSVTVLATFDRERIARVDVVYPADIALDGRCPICVALTEQYGRPTTADTTSVGINTRWTRWSCCELRIAHTPLTLVVSYVNRQSTGKRAGAARSNTAGVGQRQLQ